jgi:Zn-dependent protease with chaperone function
MSEQTEKAARLPSEQEILNALSTTIKLPSVSSGYRLGMLLTSLAMILLPLVYLGLIALTIYGVYLHGVQNVGMLEGTGTRIRLFMYATPIAVGVILVLFMIKPIFAKPALRSKGHRVRRSDAPLLFSFVERLCRILKAPVPTRIQADVQINASAGLELDMVTMTRKETILTIGLPLVAGMSLMELTGVLSHEFGHFRQGTGMRFSQLIRRINSWFGRVVYERDEWDEKLVEWSREGSWSALIAGLARLCVWLSRGILWILMTAGHAISSFLMRQMEFHADQHEVLIAGTDTFAQTAMRIRVLSVANQLAFAELSDSLNEGRLSDNLPLHIVAKAKSFSKESLQAIRQTAEGSTGLFDTHPSDRARAERARRMAAPGIFRPRAPASILFPEFEELCKRVTLEFYRQVLGNVRKESLISTQDYQEHQDKLRISEEAASRYFQGLLSATRMLPLNMRRLESSGDGKTALKNLFVSRMYLEERLPDARKAYGEYGQAVELMTNAFLAAGLLDAGIRPDTESFRLPAPTHQGAERLRTRASMMMESQIPFIQAWEKHQRLRMISALECLQTRDIGAQVTDTDELVKEASRLLTCQFHLQLALPQIVELREKGATLELLGNQLSRFTDNEPIVQHMTTLIRCIRHDLLSVFEGLKGTPYPFANADDEINCSQYFLRDMPQVQSFAFGTVGAQLDGDTLVTVYQAGQELCQRYYTLHLRVLGHLALIAERVEEAVGLEPLALPQDE